MQFSHDADTDIRIYEKDESPCTESTLYALEMLVAAGADVHMPAATAS